jgi:hypothetical protein
MNKEKNKELVFSIIVGHLLKSKKGFLLLLVVRDKVGANYKKKPPI